MTAHTEHNTTTVSHKVGICPACRDYLWADVDLTTTVSPPTIAEDGRTSVYANARAVGMRVSHQCSSDEDKPSPR